MSVRPSRKPSVSVPSTNSEQSPKPEEKPAPYPFSPIMRPPTTREERIERAERYNMEQVMKKLFVVPAYKDKQDVIDARDECVRLFGKRVRDLPLLCCTLRVLYELRGPFLQRDIVAGAIDLAFSGGELDACYNWTRHGIAEKDLVSVGLLVKAPFSPGSWLQPHASILKMNFAVLPYGLPTHMYKILRAMKEPQTVDAIIEQIEKLPSERELRGWSEIPKLYKKRNAITVCTTLYSNVFHLDMYHMTIELHPDYTFLVVKHPYLHHKLP